MFERRRLADNLLYELVPEGSYRWIPSPLTLTTTIIDLTDWLTLSGDRWRYCMILRMQAGEISIDTNLRRQGLPLRLVEASAYPSVVSGSCVSVCI